MKCIFCLSEKPPSDEHVIPESVGGRLRIRDVCSDCNSHLSKVVDNPFANSPAIELARFTHSLGGKRDKVPFPFGGVGTVQSGQKVSVDRDFQPHMKRFLDIKKDPEGGLHVQFSADLSDRDKVKEMLGEPLRKVLATEFPEWGAEKLDEEIAKIVAHAEAAIPRSEHLSIKYQWRIGMEDLLFEFLKIAYEIWFRQFGHQWIEESVTAKKLRTAIMNRDPSLPIRGQLFAPEVPVPGSDPSKNHCLLMANGGCVLRLFNVVCAVECEEADKRFILGDGEARVILQDFLEGTIRELPLAEVLR